jgi:hypothetical protein
MEVSCERIKILMDQVRERIRHAGAIGGSYRTNAGNRLSSVPSPHLAMEATSLLSLSLPWRCGLKFLDLT